ncbi:MAG: protein-methionine-sulfoxide reductase catalytic subunit MsrP [Nitrospina sp.]|nr:protein-methionine-sulfoxide reductase catalytic subunit MsrP [Nitrospina sp.]
MASIKIPKSWQISEQEVTPEDIYLRRREFLGTSLKLGSATMAAIYGFSPFTNGWSAEPEQFSPSTITPEIIASRFNNFYEFGVEKQEIWKSSRKLQTEGWRIEVGGLVKNPQTLEFETLKFPEEERIYRLRCVEAWSVVIPWIGFPLRLLIDKLEPLASARYIKFTTFLDPIIAPGQKKRFWEPWPYTEGLRLDEARHDLTFMATGIYGHPLPNQHGAPLRLVIPWKYGFKSIKSIARIEFTREEPETFYTSLSPLVYDFDANVHPDIPYARWHQAFERIPGQEETVKTLPYNGYANQVAGLYL